MPERDKKELLDSLKKSGYLKTKKIIKAFEDIPREEFIPSNLKRYSYADRPLPIGVGQTISAPHMVALMTELLEPKPGDSVLEIGGGSGYQAAILSRLVKRVYAIELVPRLVSYAKANLKKTKCNNVEVIQGDGGDGYMKNAPYDKIIITCATPRIYEAWKQQLKESGILLAPVGSSFVQTLTKGVIKNHRFVTVGILDCVFVPLKH